jgi:hypothetical protein
VYSMSTLSLILAMLFNIQTSAYLFSWWSRRRLGFHSELRMSYTQNVRVILKQYFKQSQFIFASPTSLKDSMFNMFNQAKSHPALIGLISRVQTKSKIILNWT